MFQARLGASGNPGRMEARRFGKGQIFPADARQHERIRGRGRYFPVHGDHVPGPQLELRGAGFAVDKDSPILDEPLCRADTAAVAIPQDASDKGIQTAAVFRFRDGMGTFRAHGSQQYGMAAPMATGLRRAAAPGNFSRAHIRAFPLLNAGA
ncbi:hypothetical protein KL86DPRO_10719 [uncultured delta proteobacterium]|uniref:Uncharacterized protein n=1 Tax=uncultured delta proteobacterium TaxID=34034 RepID=A0A212J552_9DELT|nr:hypothetical protein KL86DPRO_10719 [uncultured delta proteobacterium]